MQKLTFTIGVHPRTKKNHSNIVTLKNGRTILIPSKAYKDFEKEVCLAIKDKFGNKFTPIDFPINVKALYYQNSNRRADLCNYHAALHDALVKSNLIKDDNFKIIVSTDGSRVYVDKENPRIEVEITRLEGDNNE